MPNLLILMVFLTDFSNTEIFKPLHSGKVVLSDSGQVLILDRDEYRILIYDEQGKFVKSFGKKGEGPGEFGRVYAITKLKDRVYIHDMKGLSVFNFDGDYIESVGSGEIGASFTPVQDGWFLMKTGFDEKARSTSQKFSILNKDQKELLFLGEYSHEMNFDFNSKKPVIKFNPVEGYPGGHVDQTGTFLAFKGKDDFPITVYQVFPSLKKVFELKLTDRNPIPFDKTWADGVLAKNQDRQKRFSLEPDYPDFFPIVQDIRVSPDNHLMVSLWSKNPDVPEILLFDWSGAPLVSPYSMKFYARVLYVREEMAYVACYDEENEDYIVKTMAVKDCEEYIKEHPYTEDFN